MEGIVALFPKVLIDLGVVLFHMGNCCLGFCRETISELFFVFSIEEIVTKNI